MKRAHQFLTAVKLSALLLPLLGACSQKSPSAGTSASANAGAAGSDGHVSNAGGESGADDSPGAAGAVNDAGAAGESHEAGAPDSSDAGAGGTSDDFVDPVRASQSDTDVLGTDADGNGVRDDLGAYIKSLFPDPSEQALLMSLAREETQMALLGADPTSSVASVRDQALRSMAVDHCVVDALGAERTRPALTELQSALLNNELRWSAWLAAEHKLGGSVLRSMACDTGLVQP